MDLIKMAKFSRIAYKRDARIKEELKKMNYEDVLGDMFCVQIFNIDGLKCFITHKDGETIISIRGSNNLKNWLRNFDIGKLQLAQGRVHGGFLKNAEKLYRHIKDRIDYRDKIYVTGHSLGGALAMLIANFLYEDFRDVRGVAAFECPNISDKRYIKNTESYKFKRVMFKNNIDLVTKVPPFFMEYYNYNCDLVYFNKDDVAIINPTSITMFLDRFKTYLNPSNWVELAEDHLMDNILSLVLKNKDIIERIGEIGK